MIDLETRESRNILTSIHQQINLLIIYQPQNPKYKRVFIINEFSPAMDSVPYHIVKGKDITDLISQDFFSQYLGTNPHMNAVQGSNLRRQTFETAIGPLPIQHIQFSKDYSYEFMIAGY